MSQQSVSNCDHKIHRDMIRTFVISGIKIKMKYKRVDTYAIDIVKFRDIDSSDYLRSLALEEFDLIKDNFPCCIKDLHNELQRVKSVLIKISKHTSIFTELYNDIVKLLLSVENDMETFEKDAFNEIEKYASKRHEKNDIYALILLRKKIFIQLFNFICILYKSKRLIKRVCDAHEKLEIKDRTPAVRRTQRGHHKLDHSSSISKTREQHDNSLRVNVENLNRHSSVNESAKVSNELNLIVRRMSKEHEPVEAEKEIRTDLIAEKRPRKTSIEVIAEEKEDLIEDTLNSKNGANSEVIKEVNSENNEIMPEVQIEMADFDPNYHQAQTENIHNSDHGFPHLDEEDAADYLKELQAILLDNESTFLENENFGQLKKGLISLD